MGFFGFLYNKVISWAAQPSADRYLFALSFAESSFFPIPPDTMLIPMCLAQKKRVWYLSGITTLASVLGGVLGYLIGYYIFDLIELWLKQSEYWVSYESARGWFSDWGLWAVLLAGFLPIPYKIFTIAAGITNINFFGFILFSLIGRGLRFYMIALLIFFGGDNISLMLERYIERIGWSLLLILGISLLYF